MPVDQERAVAGILMLAGQFVLQAYDYLQHQPMQAPQPQLPADVFSLKSVSRERKKLRPLRMETSQSRAEGEGFHFFSEKIP